MTLTFYFDIDLISMRFTFKFILRSMHLSKILVLKRIGLLLICLKLIEHVLFLLTLCLAHVLNHSVHYNCTLSVMEVRHLFSHLNEFFSKSSVVIEDLRFEDKDKNL